LFSIGTRTKTGVKPREVEKEISKDPLFNLITLGTCKNSQ